MHFSNAESLELILHDSLYTVENYGTATVVPSPAGIMCKSTEAFFPLGLIGSQKIGFQQGLLLLTKRKKQTDSAALKPA